jgi:uncharacterized repeat protein (TIGR03803 family)
MSGLNKLNSKRRTTMKFVSQSSRITMTGWLRRFASASARLASTATILSIICVTAVIAAPAQVSTVYSFTGKMASYPYWSLVQGTNGDLYGVTISGGTAHKGSVFKVSPEGKLATIYSFCSENQCSSGGASSLILGSNGNFYGSTYLNNGTIFEITPAGKLTTLYTFCSQPNCTDGSSPYGSPLQGMDGNFYGTTQGGGANGAGTIYKLTPTGILTTLYNFASKPNWADGGSPNSGVIQDAGGNLYGTTDIGGEGTGCLLPNVGSTGCGTVFKLSPSGALTTLYTFCSLSNCADGQYTQGPLTLGSDGYLYGTTPLGGAAQEGTAFQLTLGGTLTTLHSFCTETNCTDGRVPSSLIQASDGNFYGATYGGNGTNGAGGSIFQITPSGTFSVLYTSSVNQLGPLVQGTNGTFYGTSSNGGTKGDGSIFSFNTGLDPFVEAETNWGATVSSVVILGSDLTGATYVTFSGIPAKFKVVSATEIKATVPSIATTGPIRVTTPNGTLSTTAPFEVLPLGTFHIQNVNSDMYIGVQSASLSNGAPLVQWNPDGSLDQEWIVSMEGNGVYKILDVKSQLLIGVSSASKEEGAQLVQWVNDGSSDQEWQFFPTGTNWLITDVNSGMQMAISGNSTTEGASVIQWPANGTPSQLFTLAPAN